MYLHFIAITCILLHKIFKYVWTIINILLDVITVEHHYNKPTRLSKHIVIMEFLLYQIYIYLYVFIYTIALLTALSGWKM